MNELRKARLSAVIQEELSIAIRGLKDPRVPLLTITRVEVTDDGAQATIYLTLFGKLEGSLDRTSQAMKDCLEGLASASGFLRRGIAKVLTVKHIPTLLFKEDRGLANATRVHELLNEINGVKPPVGSSSSSDSTES